MRTLGTVLALSLVAASAAALPGRAPAAPAPPADFAMEIGGGPVAAWMAAGMTLRSSRVEPRSATPGAFDLVVSEHDVDDMGMPGPDREIARVAVPADRVAALWAIVRDRRAELEGVCFDPSIRDGATTAIRVHANGADHVFRCTNARTPAFSALGATYRQLVQDFGPA